MAHEFRKLKNQMYNYHEHSVILLSMIDFIKII